MEGLSRMLGGSFVKTFRECEDGGCMNVQAVSKPLLGGSFVKTEGLSRMLGGSFVFCEDGGSFANATTE